MTDNTFKLMPDERVLEDYPWQAWAAGWLGAINGLLWLFSETVISGPAGKALFLKYLVFSVLFLVFSAGTWNLRRWGRIGLMATALLDLVLFVASFKGGLGLDFLSILNGEGRKYSLYLTAVVLISGPLGDIGILGSLAASGAVFRKDGEGE